MPAAADKKRKKADSGKASPAKKRKLDTSQTKAQKKGDKTPKKSTPAKVKKVTSVSKAKKSSAKGAKAKSADKSKKAKPEVKKVKKDISKQKKVIPVKKNVKPKSATKTTPAKPSSKANPKTIIKKSVPERSKQSSTVNKKLIQNKSKNDKAKKATTVKKAAPVQKKQLSVKTVTKTKLNNAKTKKAQTTVAKAKLKAVKSLASAKKQQNRKPAAKPKAEKKPLSTPKPEEKKTTSKSTTEKPKAADKKPKATDTKQSQKKIPEKAADKPTAVENKKRKNVSETEAAETPRKKRVITPNKRYADFETDTSPKRMSELRAFVQDKKKTPSTTKTDSSGKSPKVTAATSKQESTPVKRVTKESDEREKEPKQSPQIKVIKTSEMKPAEKLLKKLQRKLEKEAKAAFAKPKQSPNKDSVKTKITKVVTYNKPADPKVTTKTLFQKGKPKPAVIVKKKPTPISEKADKLTPKVVHSQKKVKENKREDRKIQTKFLFQKNVRQGDDASTTCWVTGIDVFKSGEIVFVDMANKKIKLFNSAFEYMSQAKLDTTPQDISISPVDASVAYFTKPFSKEGIQKICLSDGTLTLKDSFLTNGTNRGIKCIKSGILTSVQNGRYHDLDINCFKIELLDYKGNMIQSVSMDQNGIRLFKLPLYFTVNNTGKQIIVSDCIRNNSYIVSLDMSGKIKFKFTGVRDNPITPRGLTTDDDNNIYVTEWERHNVYVLTPAGKRIQLLLDHAEQLKEGQDGLKKPYQLCYYKHEDGGRLIVSQESCNTVKVFQISQRQPEQNGAAEVSSNGKPLGAATTSAPKTGSKQATVDAPVVKSPKTVDTTAEKLKTDAGSKEVLPKAVPKSDSAPVAQTSTTGVAVNSMAPAAANILSQEHAYTTLAAPAEKPTEMMGKTEDLPSDPVEEENPEELSSLVDSIISDFL